ncbi:hypothetical protein [Granulicella mallensis]|uniref:Outer membrane lipoprotein-sorting protein n=1 Tax=Granulicella mallensis (strain ATCC BAA-1857 / DSM 23137 / MP5ACTX8) TaxID=682795 RepID=G8P1I1_GRAMM|nr:hypothetical protein [Granulicella mallensis]AEU34720.1 hypothetical protein AciX8_0365 [Granulicella mallensis MP5ACTX8]
MKNPGWIAIALLMLGSLPMQAYAQASAIPSAQPVPETQGENRGRKLLDQMVTALGGEAWLNRVDWITYGKGATFYKGQANPYVSEFEEYTRAQPFGDRVVIVSKMGVFIPTSKRDIAEVWTLDNGYEITFRGKKELPKDDVEDFQRRRRHKLDVVVKDWLHQPDVLVTYEGTSMVGRRLADKVSVLTASNDAVTIDLDESTHLPLSRTFEWRNATYRDHDVDEEQYDGYQPVQGIMTPLIITRLHNGDMVTQRFLTKVVYNSKLSADLFDPDRPLEKKAK